jgi:hypothetical protein
MLAAAAVASKTNSAQDTEFLTKVRVEIYRRFTKARWVVLTRLYYTLSKYGLPYGGVVRDYIAHIDAAKSYYAYCKENEIAADVYYNESTVHTETYKGRGLLPNDIDIFITKEKFDELIKVLSAKFNLTKKHTNPNYFFKSNELLQSALTHEKWTIDLFSFSNDDIGAILLGRSYRRKAFEWSIDFVIIRDDYLKHEEYVNKGILYPPFGNPDFDVNLLSFTINSEYNVQPVPLPYLNYVYPQQSSDAIVDCVSANIKKKRALPVYPIKELYTRVFGNEKCPLIGVYRIYKMLCKRYSIDYYNTIMPEGVVSIWANPEESSSACCSGCQEPFTEKNPAVNTRGSGSDSGGSTNIPNKMHLICYRNFLDGVSEIDTSSCPCEQINFLLRLSFIIDRDLWCALKSKYPCAIRTCGKYFEQCTCWFFKCNTCKKTTNEDD